VEVISIAAEHIRTSRKLPLTAKLKIPVAVCLSKIDLLSESPLGNRAVPWLRSVRDTAKQVANLQTLQARSELCERILPALFPSNLQLALEQNFAHIMYFPMTAVNLVEAELGTRDFSKRTHQPFGILEPLLWLLERNGYRALHGERLWFPNT
jgi:hypothetical protein